MTDNNFETFVTTLVFLSETMIGKTGHINPIHLIKEAGEKVQNPADLLIILKASKRVILPNPNAFKAMKIFLGATVDKKLLWDQVYKKLTSGEMLKEFVKNWGKFPPSTDEFTMLQKFLHGPNSSNDEEFDSLMGKLREKIILDLSNKDKKTKTVRAEVWKLVEDILMEIFEPSAKTTSCGNNVPHLHTNGQQQTPAPKWGNGAPLAMDKLKSNNQTAVTSLKKPQRHQKKKYISATIPEIKRGNTIMLIEHVRACMEPWEIVHHLTVHSIMTILMKIKC